MAGKFPAIVISNQISQKLIFLDYISQQLETKRDEKALKRITDMYGL
ncbi:hypothetical protein SAMN05216323_100512 [Williamwhitmania taraxaci]|uniref:Uncharacterized protein n=1 Tax=Williamwhitmania taraxaci TaxID=1640674 RepID=A0A1G6GXR6_9BACT|nr:hypothetical protein SAMN05216323_100512 [Williamwhitmania taraxaci]